MARDDVERLSYGKDLIVMFACTCVIKIMMMIDDDVCRQLSPYKKVCNSLIFQ